MTRVNRHRLWVIDERYSQCESVVEVVIEGGRFVILDAEARCRLDSGHPGEHEGLVTWS
jgi:hypothetical protein